MYFGVFLFFWKFLINPEKEKGFTRPWTESGPHASTVADWRPDLVAPPKGPTRWLGMPCGPKSWSPRGRGGAVGEFLLAVELRRGGWRRHWRVTGKPPGKGGVAGAHQCGLASTRWRSCGRATAVWAPVVWREREQGDALVHFSDAAEDEEATTTMARSLPEPVVSRAHQRWWWAK
jgi:hypothetical protein